ncbi:MAG: hypothetical protein ACR2MS_07125 [Weeksellaceae bacterium]
MKHLNKYILFILLFACCVFAHAQVENVCKLKYNQGKAKVVPNIIMTNGPAPAVNINNKDHIEIKHPTCGKDNGSIKIKYPLNFNRKDIFISEVIDYKDGSDTYIEIYSAVERNLDAYEFRFWNNGRLTGNKRNRGKFQLKGKIGKDKNGNGNSTQVYLVGDPNNDDFPVDKNNIIPKSIVMGFNDADKIELLKKGKVIDTWGDDSPFIESGSRGYIWRRKSNNLLGNNNIPNNGDFISNKDDNWIEYDDDEGPTLSNLGKHDDFATQVEFSIDGENWRSAVSEFTNLGEGTYNIQFRYKSVSNSEFVNVADCESIVKIELKDDYVPLNPGKDNAVNYCEGTILKQTDAEKLIGEHDPNGEWNVDFPYTVSENYQLTYTLKSNSGCGEFKAIIDLTVTSATVLNFDNAEICQGEIYSFPDTQGVSGNWSPSKIDTKKVGTTTYTFKPTNSCDTGDSFDLTVTSATVLNFDNAEICQGETYSFPDTQGVSGNWSPSKIDTNKVGTTTYTFTPTNSCDTGDSFKITIIPTPITTKIKSKQ